MSDTTPTEWGLCWGHPKVMTTKQGLRTLREAPVTDAFLSEWKRSMKGMSAKGYSLSRNTSGFVVLHWGIPSPAPDPEDELVTPPEVRVPHVQSSGLLPYQIEPARDLVKALTTWGAALDGSDTGTGKTFTALAVMKAMGVNPVVVCPKSVVASWERAADHFGVTVYCANYEKIRNGSTRFGKWVQLEAADGTTVDRFHWAPSVKGLIFDECHRCKNDGTQNSAMMIGARIRRVPTLALSATAVTNPIEMRALGYLLGLHGLSDYSTWLEAHGCFINWYSKWQFGGTDQDMERIRSQIFGTKGVRVRVSDLGDQFPRTLITTRLVDVESPDKLSAAYLHLRQVFAEIETRKKTDSTKAEHLTAMLRALQTAEAQKIPHLIEMAEDAIAEGRSVVIGVNYMDTLRTLETALGKRRKVSVVHGEQTKKGERDRHIDDFQRNKTHGLIMTVAGTEGINLQDLYNRPRTSLLSPGFSAVKVKQFLGRIWRAGAKSGSVQYLVYARGTEEERVAENIEAKLRRLKIFNDGLEELDLTDDDFIG